MNDDILNIEKLSEKTLYQVLTKLFPTVTSITKKTFIMGKRRVIVDWYFEFDNQKFAIEFDGPTHFTRTKTQLRDLGLTQYCIDNNIILIRIPYFIQIDNVTLDWLFGYKFCKKHSMHDKVETEYPHGFIDDACILPADYNVYGQMYFCDLYMSLLTGNEADYYSVAMSIWHYAHEMYLKEEFIGIFPSCDDIETIWENYPS